MRARPAPPNPLGVISHICGGMLLLLIGFGPLAFACTLPGPLKFLSWGLHVVAGIWLLGLAVERRKPGIPRLALISTGALIVYAWLRFWLFPAGEITSFTSGHFSRIYERWPESVILRTPYTITLVTSGLLVGFLIATDLTRQTLWRRGVLITMVGVGCVVVFLGLIQNATHAPGIYWQMPKNHMPSRFFGPFYHFTSAGAFINLTWPIAGSMALYSLRRYISETKSLFPVFAWSSVSILLLLGHAGHVSRFPQVIAFVMLIGLVAIHRPLANWSWSWRTAAVSGVTLTIVGVAIVGIVGRTGRIHDIADRWQMLNVWSTEKKNPPPPSPTLWPQLMRDDLVVPYDHSHYFLRDRGAAYAFAVTAAMQRPLWGFGPGGWISAVSQLATDPTIGTFYLYLQFTHQDFLQAWVEWGLVGCIFWLILLIGATYKSFSCLTKHSAKHWRPDQSTALIVGALAAVVAVLVQSMIDFPLQIPANALYFSVLLAVCWSSAICDTSPLSSTNNVHEQ